MIYNTQRKKLPMPEYGRGIQEMVDYALTLENREERQRCARTIVSIMGNMFPHLRDVPDFKHKLWDHLAIMADYKLDIDYQTVIECNSKVYKTNNIIGTTTYDSIEDKLYRKYNTDFAYKIGQRRTEQGILFSGRIYGKTTTITVDKQYADTLNKISAELKEQRASFMSKSEVVQNESPEESKSVNEKISELHFNESQLSALAPSVKFIQTRNDDNLTDNFVSLF